MVDFLSSRSLFKALQAETHKQVSLGFNVISL